MKAAIFAVSLLALSSPAFAASANLHRDNGVYYSRYVREVASCVYRTMGNEGTHVSMRDCLSFSNEYSDSRLPVKGACHDVVKFFNQLDKGAG